MQVSKGAPCSVSLGALRHRCASIVSCSHLCRCRGDGVCCLGVPAPCRWVRSVYRYGCDGRCSHRSEVSTFAGVAVMVAVASVCVVMSEGAPLSSVAVPAWCLWVRCLIARRWPPYIYICQFSAANILLILPPLNAGFITKYLRIVSKLFPVYPAISNKLKLSPL